ncbi:hypothetical protein C8K44_115106 [Aminobacter sp. AP02]|nr:hypothetical protein C8K44_115106 [Aminobacter sp. AP02]
MFSVPDKRQLEMFEFLYVPADVYTDRALAKKYGLSRGQALGLMKLYGPSRPRLDRVMAAQPYP